MLQDMPSCDDLPSLPPTVDRCLYVREHCDAEGLIPFLKLYYCHLNASGWPFWALTLFGAAILLVVLFRVIGRTADEFFSKILSQISQDMGLPPRLGGVTLLALGNGAPDLSSSIAAVRSGNYLMALGALTGSTMFVGCVVAGKIITEHGGVKSRAAQIRDVLMQLVAVGFVTITRTCILYCWYEAYEGVFSTRFFLISQAHCLLLCSQIGNGYLWYCGSSDTAVRHVRGNSRRGRLHEAGWNGMDPYMH